MLEQYRGERDQQDRWHYEIREVVRLEFLVALRQQNARQPGLRHQREDLCKNDHQQVTERNTKCGWLHRRPDVG